MSQILHPESVQGDSAFEKGIFGHSLDRRYVKFRLVSTNRQSRNPIYSKQSTIKISLSR